MEKELNWAIIGTGVIANEMAQALQRMDKTLYGVANRTQAKAIDFAKKYGVKKVYDEIDEVFDDENIDIIYAQKNACYRIIDRYPIIKEEYKNEIESKNKAVELIKEDRVKYFEFLRNNDSNGLAEWLKELSTREEERMKWFGYKFL